MSSAVARGTAREYLKSHGFHHTVLLPGPLAAGTTYHYRVGDGGAKSKGGSSTAPGAAPGVTAMRPAPGVEMPAPGSLAYSCDLAERRTHGK